MYVEGERTASLIHGCLLLVIGSRPQRWPGFRKDDTAPCSCVKFQLCRLAKAEWRLLSSPLVRRTDVAALEKLGGLVRGGCIVQYCCRDARFSSRLGSLRLWLSSVAKKCNSGL
jgi:hypothetical protein